MVTAELQHAVVTFSRRLLDLITQGEVIAGLISGCAGAGRCGGEHRRVIGHGDVAKACPNLGQPFDNDKTGAGGSRYGRTSQGDPNLEKRSAACGGRAHRNLACWHLGACYCGRRNIENLAALGP